MVSGKTEMTSGNQGQGQEQSSMSGSVRDNTSPISISTEGTMPNPTENGVGTNVSHMTGSTTTTTTSSTNTGITGNNSNNNNNNSNNNNSSNSNNNYKSSNTMYTATNIEVSMRNPMSGSSNGMTKGDFGSHGKSNNFNTKRYYVNGVDIIEGVPAKDVINISQIRQHQQIDPHTEVFPDDTSLFIGDLSRNVSE
ncbi:hypothetical protein RFI_12627, partial [Reticulomyxa filosa]